jgi:hypothetical protein
VEGVTGERHRSFVDRLLVDPAERKKVEKGKKKKKRLRSVERKKAVDEAPVGVGSGREEES